MNFKSNIILIVLSLLFYKLSYSKNIYIKELSGYLDTCNYRYSPGRVNKPMRMILSKNTDFNIYRTGLDIGTGTGILALLMARLGMESVVATDIDEYALKCAEKNIKKYNLERRVKTILVSENQDPYYFLKGKRVGLIVSNPPWIDKYPNFVLRRPYLYSKSLLYQILKGSENALTEKGILILELGSFQKISEARYFIENNKKFHLKKIYSSIKRHFITKFFTY